MSKIDFKIGDIVEAIIDVPRNKVEKEEDDDLCEYYEFEDFLKKETQLLIVDLFSMQETFANREDYLISFSDFPEEKYLSKDFKKVPERSWMDRDYRKEKVFMMPVEYVVDHLDDFAKRRMDLSKYDAKEISLTEDIESGLETIYTRPPFLSLDKKDEVFHITDGTTRLRYALRKKISHLRIKLIE